MNKKPDFLRPERSAAYKGGLIFVLVGVATFLAFQGQSGFFKGFLVGICIVSMAMGAYYIGWASFSKKARAGLTDDDWLPSRDER